MAAFMKNFNPANPVSNMGAHKNGNMGDFKTPNAKAPIAAAQFQSVTVPNSISQPIKVPMMDGTSGAK